MQYGSDWFVSTPNNSKSLRQQNPVRLVFVFEPNSLLQTALELIDAVS
jgi:hypothetical protein